MRVAASLSRRSLSQKKVFFKKKSFFLSFLSFFFKTEGEGAIEGDILWERLLAPAGAWVPPYTAPRHPLFLQENHSFVLEKFHDSSSKLFLSRSILHLSQWFYDLQRFSIALSRALIIYFIRIQRQTARYYIADARLKSAD